MSGDQTAKKYTKNVWYMESQLAWQYVLIVIYNLFNFFTHAGEWGGKREKENSVSGQNVLGGGCKYSLLPHF